MPNSENNSNIKILSSEVQEVISQKPSWVVRNGIVLFLAIIAVLFAATFFIKYPDVVNTNATFVSVNAPKEVKVKQEGKLVKLLVTEGKQVEQGEVLGFVESNASHAEVMDLAKKLSLLQQDENYFTKAPLLFSYHSLGELQQFYQTFIQAANTYKQYLPSGYYYSKQAMLFKDVSFLQQQSGTLLEQKQLQQQDLELTRKNFEANKSLSADKVIADVEFRNEKSKLIAKTLTIPQITSAIIANQSSKHEKEKEIAALSNDIAQQKAIFNEALNTFAAQVADWESRYLLKAPVKGRVSFADFVQENSQLKTEENICYVTPENISYYAAIFIPQNNFGKVKVGERVQLKLNAFPYREFGFVNAKLDFISSIPTDSGFSAKAILPNGLTTNYKKKLTYTEGLTAQAEIITNDVKLSDRLLQELKAIFYK
jgi:multidrug efflux pump subunit AcrA (membrane-fusion protein)